MKSLPFSKIRFFVIALAFLLLSGNIGYQVGKRNITVSVDQTKRIVINQETPATSGVDFSLFWDVWQKLHQYYIDQDALVTQKMVYGAISGMVNSLDDPYTAFLPPKENKDFKEDLGGAFEGIGAQLGMKDSRVMVVAPLKGMPAEKAGIKTGDFILKVNDEDTTGWTVTQAVTKIRGPRGTKVTLSILHEGAQKSADITVVRDTISVPSVESWVKKPSEVTEISGTTAAALLNKRPERIAYIHLSRFGDRTNEEWEQIVKDIAREAKSKGVKGLVFDLRNNPGGYLEGAVFIASEFIDSGIVVSQLNSDGSKEDFSVSRKGSLLSVPVAVLINKGSASASEIVAGALRDHNRARLIGVTSFGKGSVQTPLDLKEGAGIHITTGKWLTPKGTSINKTGITPDFEVNMDSDEASADAQLAKAIELLLQ